MSSKVDYIKLSNDAIKATLYIISKKYFDVNLAISFFTNFKGVELPDYIKSAFPTNITIVLQYQFRDLILYDDFFSVILSFKGKEEKIVVPFKSINSFVLNLPKEQKDHQVSKYSIVSRNENVLFIDNFTKNKP